MRSTSRQATALAIDYSRESLSGSALWRLTRVSIGVDEHPLDVWVSVLGQEDSDGFIDFIGCTHHARRVRKNRMGV
jgi:hypothetical protein